MLPLTRTARLPLLSSTRSLKVPSRAPYTLSPTSLSRRGLSLPARSSGPHQQRLSVFRITELAHKIRGLATMSDTSRNPLTEPPIPLEMNPFPPCPPIPKASGPVDLILPPTEDRPHKYFTLPNGLECIVVSDPKADKAAASMDVGVGHLSDPDDLPGCAHFCEHMMFLGTKKYPVENEYSTYLSSHNGHSNAWTAMTSTNYFFDVAPDALEGALDRFAGFFSEPMFAEDCTEREINAVNSEHKKNIQNDMWRTFQLEKSLSKPGHPFGKFGTGNRETLWDLPKAAGRDPRQQLISWWEREYCARRMKLALVGKEDVEVLEKWVKERFEKVPVRTEGRPEVGRDGVRIVFEDSPFSNESLNTITFTKPVRDQRGLEITWPFPDVDHLYKSRPGNFVAHFLGYEGKGSILSYLKRQGWVNHIRAGPSHGASGFDMMKCSVDLTPEGLDHYLDIALVIFKYISLLRSQPPSKTIFDEIKAIGDIGFRFAERGRTADYVSGLSSWMQDPVPREKIVSSKYVLENFDEAELASALTLLDPRRAILGLISQTMPKGVEGGWDKTEPIYGTEYTQRKLGEDFVREAMKGSTLEDLALPGPNKFIPENLDVQKFEVEKPVSRPVLLKDTPLSRLWYKRDDTFWIPKANVDVSLTSPLFEVSPRNAVLARLLCDLFSDSITEESYDAELAELNFSLHFNGEAIQISAGGFSDKLSVLTETMLKTLVEFKIDEERFEKIKDQVKRYWINFAMSEPYNLANYWHTYVTTENMWTQEEKLKEIEFVTPAEVKAFGKEVFKRLWIETLVHGNTSLEGAKEIQNMVERVLSPRPLTPGEKKAPRTLLLAPATEHIYSRPVTNPAEVNNAIVYYLHVGDPTDPSLRAKLSLFAQISSEPTFNVLRTKEQLGYTVFSGAIRSAGSMGFRLIVQSEKSAVYVETRIEAFLESMKEVLDGLSDEEFGQHVQSLVDKEEEKPKNLGQESRRYWNRIQDRYYDFGKSETNVRHLRQTTKKDVQDFWSTFISTSSPSRTKLSTHLNSQAVKPDATSSSSSTTPEIKFDAAAAAPLAAAFQKHAVVIDTTALGGLMASKPSLEQVQQFAKAAVDETLGLSEEAKEELKVVIAGLKGSEVVDDKVEGQEVKVRETNVYVEDIYRFKAELVPSKGAVPIEPLTVAAKL